MRFRSTAPLSVLVIGFSFLALSACSSSGPGTPTTGGVSTGGAGTTGSTTGSTGGGTAGSTGGGATLGSPCTFDQATDVDSCAVDGYECSSELNLATGGHCILPQANVECLTSVGCQDGGSPELVCKSGFTHLGGQPISECAFPCAETSDCESWDQICSADSGVCVDDYCDQSGPLEFEPPFFNTCPVLDAGDGQCLPFAAGQVAICFQEGTAETGMPCNPYGRVGGAPGCAAGNWCVLGESKDGGLCLPIVIDAGCPSGEEPLPVTNIDPLDWEVCFQDCPDGACPYGQCYAVGTATNRVCLPQ